MRKVSIAVLVVLALILVVAPGASAKKTPVDVSGSTFDGSGNAKAKIQKYGSEKGAMTHDLRFGAQAGLAANEFRLTLDDGVEEIVIPGTWTTDTKGRPVLTPNAAALESALTDLFWSYAGGEISGVSIDIDVTKLKLKPKPKYKKKTGETTLKLSLKIVFVVTASAMGQSETVKTSIAYKGKGSKL